MIKVVSLFLIGMLVLAMFGRLKYPGHKQVARAKCKSCGKVRFSKSPCRCQKGKVK